MKTCFKCGLSKELSLFHKHKRMKDGHLNKCAACVLKDVTDWRAKNPNCRKEEYKKNFISKRKQPIKGRKAVLLQYTAKRRTQQKRHTITELDELVFIEAVDLRERRNKLTGFKWHVDHIVPLNNKQACGLHNGFNLQVVPASWNLRKQATNMNNFFISGY